MSSTTPDPSAHGFAFPDGFLWGAATSAFQIEGAASEDGRGESIWDRMAATPGKIEDGSDASVACDHYHLWRDDLDRMRWLGLGAYRFSIAWPRILPAGRGPVNARGLAFYDALVDGLLERGIEPFVTLYHWDLPQTLQDAGGWASRSVVDAFVDYAGVVVKRLGDRVRFWTTHNEPWCAAHLGYEEGAHAPGHRQPAEALRAAHHLLLSHGRAVEVVRSAAAGARVGIVLNLVPAYPASNSDADRDAVRSFDGFFNRWYLDPLYRGRYPEDAIQDRILWGHLSSSELPFVQPGDLEAISAPIDLLGVNYYSRVVIRSGPKRRPEAVPQGRAEDRTEMGWELYPDGLRDLLVRVHRDYAPGPMYITENGAAFPDPPAENGRIRDPRRVDYLRTHLAAAHAAIGSGVPLRGYFVWSLLDNFEWAHGYTKRFGLFGMDYGTRERIPKDSASWYREAIASGRIDHGPPASLSGEREPAG